MPVGTGVPFPGLLLRLDGSTQRGFCFIAPYEYRAKQVTLLAMQQVKGTAAAGGEDPAWGLPISRLTFLCHPRDSRGLLSMKPTSRSVTHGTKAAVAYVVVVYPVVEGYLLEYRFGVKRSKQTPISLFVSCDIHQVNVLFFNCSNPSIP